jgi:glycosyltransferase involved in cell wall biosynthesis
MSNPTPIVTIITPTYNHDKFIGICIKSVISQTFKDWEQIIIDDASTDSTGKLIDDFSKIDKRISVVHHKKNFGINKLSNTYNEALKKAKGKFIAILEGDDYWLPDKLASQLEDFKNKNVCLSFSDCILTNSSGWPIRLFSYNNIKRNGIISSKKLLSLFSNLNFSIIPATVMVRKNNLMKVGGFQNCKQYPFTDIPTFLELSLSGNFKYCNKILAYYRKQKNSQWFNYVKNTDALGKEEILNCLNHFLYLHKKDLQKLKIKFSNAKQQKVIHSKKFILPLSLMFNKYAFSEGFNIMFIYFVLQYIKYKFKLLLK